MRMLCNAIYLAIYWSQRNEILAEVHVCECAYFDKSPAIVQPCAWWTKAPMFFSWSYNSKLRVTLRTGHKKHVASARAFPSWGSSTKFWAKNSTKILVLFYRVFQKCCYNLNGCHFLTTKDSDLIFSAASVSFLDILRIARESVHMFTETLKIHFYLTICEQVKICWCLMIHNFTNIGRNVAKFGMPSSFLVVIITKS